MERRAWNLYPTKLPNVCHYLGVDLNHHEALSDAMVCAQIVLAASREPATRDVGRRRNPPARQIART